MNILLINYRYFMSAGPERYMLGIEEILKVKGHKVIPFSIDYDQTLDTPYRRHFAKPPMGADNVFLKDAKLSPFRKLKMLGTAIYNFEARGKLRTLLSEEKIDVAYALQLVNLLYPSVIDACHENDIPVVYRLSDFQFVCPNYKLFRDGQICEECVGGKLYKGIVHKCLKNSLSVSTARVASMYIDRLRNTDKKIAHYITPSSIVREKMIAGGYAAEKVTQILTFVDADKVDPKYSPGDYILYVGQIDPLKGVGQLIEAYGKAEISESCKLYIVGESHWDEDKKLQRLVDERKIPNVTFLGFQGGEALADLYRGARLVVLPTLWYENIPNVLLEAMCYGKAVVGSDLGGVAEVIDDGENGRLVPAGDVEALALCLNKLVANESAIEEMGRNARAKMEQHFSPDIHYSKLMGIFETHASMKS